MPDLGDVDADVADEVGVADGRRGVGVRQARHALLGRLDVAAGHAQRAPEHVVVPLQVPAWRQRGGGGGERHVNLQLVRC